MMKKQFDQVTEVVFNCLKTKIQGQGIPLEGDSGYLSKNGISLDYAFDVGAGTLTIDNLKVGFPASMAGMNSDKVMDILTKTINDCCDVRFYT